MKTSPVDNAPDMLNTALGFLFVALAAALSEAQFSITAVMLLAAGMMLLFAKNKAADSRRQKRAMIAFVIPVLLALTLMLQWLWFFASYPILMKKFRHVSGVVAPSAELFILGVTACLLAAAFASCLLSALSASEKKLSAAFFTLFLLYVTMMAAALCVLHDPPVDAFDMFSIAGKSVRKGKNPYSVTYPNLYYNPAGNARIRGLARDPRYQTPTLDAFEYFPGIFPFAALGSLWGDIRFMFLLFHAGFALILFILAARKKEGVLWASMFLLNPAAAYVMVYSFLDPALVFFTGCFVYCIARKKSLLLPFALGYLLCLKQYAVFLLPVFRRFIPNKTVALSLLVCAIGLFSVFILSPSDFIHDTVHRPFQMFPRGDGLSFYSLLYHFNAAPASWRFPSLLCAFLFFIPLFRRMNLPQSLHFAGRTYLLFFFFLYMAFVHHYYFALSFIALSQVTDEVLTSPQEARASL